MGKGFLTAVGPWWADDQQDQNPQTDEGGTKGGRDVEVDPKKG